MNDDENNFLTVLGRLKMALDCVDDIQVAEKLALSRTAFGNRKARGSLPTDHIDALVKSEGLNPEFVYHGTGPVHLDIDVEAWEAGFRKRLTQVLGLETYAWTLAQQGHTPAQIKAVHKGEEEPSTRLLRDLQKHLGVDLNWLVVGDTSTQHTKDEESLLTLYRKATKEGQAFINQAAGMAKTRREELANKANQVMDVATGKQRPGGVAEGVRVPSAIRTVIQTINAPVHAGGVAGGNIYTSTHTHAAPVRTTPNNKNKK